MKSCLQETAQLRKIKNFCNMKDEICTGGGAIRLGEA
jgi:hypothetical protein